MALPGVHLGMQLGPYDTVVDPDKVKAFAAATHDPSPLARSGVSMPPVLLMTNAWEAHLIGRDTIINQEVRHAATGGAHGEHDMVLHRPLVPGERLRTWVRAWGSRPAGRNAVITLHYPSYDEAGELVAEQWWTTIHVNTTCEVTGQPVPDHMFPEEARSHPAGTYDVFLDGELPRRYAEVTDDWASVHFDLEAAKRNGFPGLTAHGLCSLALCSQGIVAQVGDGDPGRVRRLAGRFSAPALLGEELHVEMYEAGPQAYVFEAECAGAKVITHGRVDLRG